jgi:CBS-domain-containing membrane protein
VLLSEWQLRQALEHFDQFPYQVFPIVDSQHQLIGVLSRRELYEYIISSGIPTAKQTQRIADCFLTSDSKVYSVDPVTDIRRITALLVEKNLDALPVVEDTGRIVGIVSRSDILRCATADPPLSLWC